VTSDIAPIVAAGNLWKLSRLRTVLDRAHERGIPVLVLKGAAILGWLYSLEERAMVDVDLLVRPADRERFIAALAPEGRVRRSAAHGLLPGYKPGQFTMEFLGLSLDVHVHLLDSPWLRDIVPIDEMRLWREVVGTEIAGRPALRLSAEDQLLHFVAHAVFHHSADHGGGAGHRGEDGRRLLDRQPMDWERLINIATAQRMRLATWLYLSDATLSGLVPESVLRSLAPGRVARWRVGASRRLAATGDRSLAPVLLTDDALGIVRALRTIVAPDVDWLDRVYRDTPRAVRAARHAGGIALYAIGRVAALRAPVRATPASRRKRAQSGWEPMAFHAKARLVAEIWFWFLMVHVRLRTGTLPQAIAHIRADRVRSAPAISPVRLGRIVTRALGITGRRPRCLINALVHYRLLTELGHPAELVIGLPRDAITPDAHAWIEIGGVDVGPPPGRGPHVPLARYA
jgi:hypothetical protein